MAADILKWRRVVDLTALLPSEDEVQATLVDRIEKLPPFPLLASKLLAPGTSGEIVARIVSTDPAIAQRVLQIVNSAPFGASTHFSSITDAVDRLGPEKVRSVALNLILFDTLLNRQASSNFDRTTFWKHSLALAGIARALAEQLDYHDPEEAYTAGLLHDIGKVVLDVAGRIRYGDFVQELKNYDGPADEKERDILGLSHDDIGAYYCHHWNLPERLVLTIRFHHQPFDHLKLDPDTSLLIAIVAFADFIVWSQGFGSFDTLRQPIMNPDVEKHLSFANIQLAGLMDQMDRDISVAAEHYGFSYPSTEEFRERLLRTNISLGQINTRYYYLHGDLQQKVETLSQLQESITRPHRSLDPDEIISGTLDAIHEDFGFDRIIAFTIDSTTRTLKPTAFKDTTGLGVEVMTLEIHPDSSDGRFIECLRKHVPVLITGRDQEEAKVLSFLKTREIGIVPFTSNNKIIGLLGVDNATSGKAIRLSDLSTVSIVANELGMALENARTFEDIKQRADFDGLTRAYNRTAIDQLLAESYDEAAKGNVDLAVAMVDVDLFKEFNDQYGHLAGDSILKLIAGTLIKFSRPTEIVGRYGGEEFFCILRDTDLDGAVNYGERIRAKIQELGNLLHNRFPDHELTISIGVAEFQTHLRVKEELIDMADQAMYAAKAAGRNCVMIGWMDDTRQMHVDKPNSTRR